MVAVGLARSNQSARARSGVEIVTRQQIDINVSAGLSADSQGRSERSLGVDNVGHDETIAVSLKLMQLGFSTASWASSRRFERRAEPQ